jgi:hypothetical protein
LFYISINILSQVSYHKSEWIKAIYYALNIKISDNSNKVCHKQYSTINLYKHTITEIKSEFRWLIAYIHTGPYHTKDPVLLLDVSGLMFIYKAGNIALAV